jgi:hypothetical protein
MALDARETLRYKCQKCTGRLWFVSLGPISDPTA